MKALADYVLARDFDVRGVNLVEASAGTGKTFCIQTLYLRMVVSLGIPVRQLLVVTFTEAATSELRDRLRAILEQCRRRLECETSGQPEWAAVAAADDKRIEAILALPVENRAEAGDLRGRVHRALLDFDQAAIFTIHGFCQRALQTFSFEAGHDHDAEVIAGEPLLREGCADLWRRLNHTEPHSIADAAEQAGLPTIETLVALCQALVTRPGALVLPQHDDRARERCESRLQQILDDAVACIRNHRVALLEAVGAASADPFFPEAQRQLIREWLDRLEKPTSSPAACFTALTRLRDLLDPPKIPSPLPVPPAVAECVSACKACLVADGTGKVAPEAAQALAVQCVQDHAHVLEAFLEHMARHPDWFNKSDLTDPDKRTRLLKTIIEGGNTRSLRAALKQVAGIKAKLRVAWHPGIAASTLRERLKAIAPEAERLGRMCLAVRLKTLVEQYDCRKREAHGMTYDDMLQRLHLALSRPDGAQPLRQALRAQYAAALVDEFQDTDPVQYRIFETLFADGTLPLFLVGDPKQAIYAFRGGDIFTYCAAKRTIPASRQFSLDTNYRSRKNLVAAVNTVFRNRNGQSLFGLPEIDYPENLKSHDRPDALIDGGDEDERPFKIWDYRLSSGRDAASGQAQKASKRPTSYRSDEARLVYGAVAAEIVRLLADPGIGFSACSQPGSESAFRRLRPADIAILVRRHAEAALLYHELRRRNVPAVRQAGDNVFDSPEAIELTHLLNALAMPGNIRAIKAAWASHLLPVGDAEILPLARGEPVACPAAASIGISGFPATIDAWLEVFHDAAGHWLRNGFAMAFDWLGERIGIKAWLASRPGGERSLANLIQLQDLLHDAAETRHLGPDALLDWFRRQRDPETREENQAFETRLESDVDAVRIMTFFKSKGLEFPVVFVPTMWTHPVGRQSPRFLLYHADRPAEAPRDCTAPIAPVVLHLDPGDPEARSLAECEQSQEDVRNLYVAVTRASHRTYLVAGDLGCERSMLSACLPRTLLADWEAAPAAMGLEIVPKRFDHSDRTPLIRKAAMRRHTLKLPGTPFVDKSRGHASFSAIVPQGESPETNALFDYDAATTVPDPQPERPEPDGLTPFRFPAGARTGECWHRIFEQIDFKAEPDQIRETVAEQLALFRLDAGDAAQQRARQDVTCRMVQTVLQAELVVGQGETIRLADVGASRRRNEMAFDFALCSGRPPARHRSNAVRRTLEAAWQHATGEEARFRDRLRKWNRPLPGGFMTGFIDLFFEHRGRYYLLDWKSNRLDGRPESFDRDPGLVNEMTGHAYFLQYLIYTVAVDRYLRQCLGGGYAYERDFGGVLYLFVRGIGSDSTPGSQRGIFFTRPRKTLVDALAAALMTEGA